MSYSPALLDEIRAGVDIVDLVGRFVNLRKAGVNWKGLCPFHAEKTPSFMVNPKKGIFHCFGCGVGGDAFGFLMRQDRLTFPEAVRALAKSAGVALPEERSPARDSGREELYRVMDLAARYYADQLGRADGERARTYVDKRGIDPEVAQRFGLGYAPDRWDALLDVMRAERVAPELLEQVGLVIRRDTGSGYYDRFRGRLMFAIRDFQGRVVAFGGRAFGDEPPKYLNSPETPLYTKGNLLYAVDLARETIRQKNRALLVEGYVDCLMAHQHGFTETVAALGTAFTPAQLAILRRYCEEVVTFFDADAAGQKAAARAAELLEPSGAGAAWAVNRSGPLEAGGAFRLKVALLPAGHDPDTFLREHGAQAFAERIDGARSLLGYALDRAITDPDGAGGPRARANAFARVALMLAKVTDAEEAAALSRDAAARLGVDPTQLWIEAQKLQAVLRKPAAPTPQPPTTGAPRAEDRALVRLLLHHEPARPVLLPLVEDAEIGGGALRAIVGALRARPEALAESLMTDLAEEARNLLAGLVVEEDERAGAEPAAAVADFQRRLERGRKLRHIREVSRSIAETEAGTLPVEQMRVLDRESKDVHASTLGITPDAFHGTPGSARSQDA
ncbi:MAG: DNA primase [Candidatus Rokubacteria bacterium]|nr:DNA primase [Candidatus Rokubacteria bacterium]